MDPIAQHAIDVKQSADAIAQCEKIKNYSIGRLSMLEAIALLLQAQAPGPGQQANQLNDLDTLRVQEANAQRDAFGYEGTVKGWIAYIQTLRAIEARTPGTISPDRLVFPTMPPGLKAYADANAL
jgi:hypothetical protein